MQMTICKTLLAAALLCQPLLVAGSSFSVEREAELHNMLVQDCGSCHGLTFRGGLGPPLLPENLRNKPRDFLIATILNGRQGTAMPPWHPLMTRQEAEWMLDKLLAGTQL
jgi:cytochrome c55X